MIDSVSTRICLQGNNYLVNSPLDDKSASTGRHQLLENFFKITRNLFESPLNGFVFPLVKHLYKFFDRLSRLDQIFASLNKRITLLGEVVILFKSFLIDMGEFLQAFVDCMKLLDELIPIYPLVSRGR